MGGRQIGNRTIDNSYQNQSGVASLHREDNGHHTHACKGHHKEIPVAHVNHPGVFTLDQYCYYHIYLLGILCKLDEMTIQENIKDAFAFADSHPLDIRSCIFE